MTTMLNLKKRNKNKKKQNTKKPTKHDAFKKSYMNMEYGTNTYFFFILNILFDKRPDN